jgi:hypothetical protein
MDRQMSKITRDSMYGQMAPLDENETLIATFRADLPTYWKSHAVMALVAGVVAGAALVYGGNTAPWVGPVAAVLAIGLRAAYLKSEALSEAWKLTDRRLIGPGGRVVPLSSLKLARPFLGAVQLVTQGGDKHLIKYQADPAATVAAIEQAKAGKI